MSSAKTDHTEVSSITFGRVAAMEHVRQRCQAEVAEKHAVWVKAKTDRDATLRESEEAWTAAEKQYGSPNKWPDATANAIVKHRKKVTRTRKGYELADREKSKAEKQLRTTRKAIDELWDEAFKGGTLFEQLDEKKLKAHAWKATDIRSFPLATAVRDYFEKEGVISIAEFLERAGPGGDVSEKSAAAWLAEDDRMSPAEAAKLAGEAFKIVRSAVQHCAVMTEDFEALGIVSGAEEDEETPAAKRAAGKPDDDEDDSGVSNADLDAFEEAERAAHDAGERDPEPVVGDENRAGRARAAGGARKGSKPGGVKKKNPRNAPAKKKANRRGR